MASPEAARLLRIARHDLKMCAVFYIPSLSEAACVCRTTCSAWLRWADAGTVATRSPMTRIVIQWQDQFGRWQRFQEKHNQADAFRTAQARARSTGKRHRLVDENARLLDLLEP